MSEKKSQTEERIDTISSARKNKIRALNFLMVASFVIILAILILIIGYILCRGIPYVTWQMLSTGVSPCSI